MKKDRPFKVGVLPDRWEGGVAGLTHDGEYVYWRLSLSMMATGKRVPEEDGPAVCRFFPRYKKALEELMRKEKVGLENGELVIERALLEHRLAVEESDKAKRRGQAGADARWGAQGDAQAHAQASPTAMRKHMLKESQSSAQAIAPLPLNKEKPTLSGSEPLSGTETRTPRARGLRPLAACLPGSGGEKPEPVDPYTDPALDIPEPLRRQRPA